LGENLIRGPKKLARYEPQKRDVGKREDKKELVKRKYVHL
jgi:hypothetical protein